MRILFTVSVLLWLIGIYFLIIPQKGQDLFKLKYEDISQININTGDSIFRSTYDTIAKTDSLLIKKIIDQLSSSKKIKGEVNPKSTWSAKIEIINSHNKVFELWLLRSFTSGRVFEYYDTYYRNDSLVKMIEQYYYQKYPTIAPPASAHVRGSCWSAFVMRSYFNRHL